ncbi:hypothetical protein FTX61_08255 [Nitriliruptoraceae bacterium ZYF776]|nr:hypothetical protein [Profundirhabdus halotolerans]
MARHGRGGLRACCVTAPWTGSPRWGRWSGRSPGAVRPPLGAEPFAGAEEPTAASGRSLAWHPVRSLGRRSRRSGAGMHREVTRGG